MIRKILTKIKVMGAIYRARRLFVVMRRRVEFRRILARVRNRATGAKIRVVFVNSEPAKFKCLKLYHAMEATGRYDCVVALSAWNTQKLISDDELDKHLEMAEAFFAKMNVRCVRTVSTHPRAARDFRHLNPDIVIFNEQWVPCEEQKAERVSKYAITCFIPYYVPDYGDVYIDCLQHTEQWSHIYFTLNRYWSNYYSPYFRWWNTATRLVPVGHPALDFFERSGDAPSGDGVIYAPHFSYPHHRHTGKLLLTHGTFDWAGMKILAYAKKHPELHWIFKPHPLLRRELIATGLMTPDEADAYYAEWAHIGVACYSGDYQQLFMRSKAMITDCGSFLAEYSATGKPLIHLLCERNTAVAPQASQMLWDTFYKVHNLDEMYEVFDRVLIRNEDPKHDEHLRVVRELNLNGCSASRNIIDFIDGAVGA